LVAAIRLSGTCRKWLRGRPPRAPRFTALSPLKIVLSQALPEKGLLYLNSGVLPENNLFGTSGRFQKFLA
jgi:hypothetical protein